MSWSNPNPNHLLVKPPPEGAGLVSVPGDGLELLGTLDSASSSTLEAIPGYDHVGNVLHYGNETPQPWHFQHTLAQIEVFDELWCTVVQMVLRHNFTPPQTQIPRAGGNSPICSVTEEQEKSRPAGGRARHPCAECNKEYGRPQELGRHIRDKHRSRHRCPFSGCDFEWTRPDRMKSHLQANHAQRFPAEKMAGVNGRDFVELVNGYDPSLDVEATSQSSMLWLPDREA